MTPRRSCRAAGARMPALPQQHDFVYLASQSPRRAQLLSVLGVSHRPLLADAGEDAEQLEAVRPDDLPHAYVARVALLKLDAARRRLRLRRLPEAPILTADTTVAIGRRILGKPADPDEAIAMLQALSGRTHRVLTALAVSSGPLHFIETSVSRVRFAALSAASIRRYVATGEPRDKAGAYAVQGRIAAFIEHIEGSYSGIVGLPLHLARVLLARARVRMDL
jgi:septum formation protein